MSKRSATCQHSGPTGVCVWGGGCSMASGTTPRSSQEPAPLGAVLAIGMVPVLLCGLKWTNNVASGVCLSSFVCLIQLRGRNVFPLTQQERQASPHQRGLSQRTPRSAWAGSRASACTPASLTSGAPIPPSSVFHGSVSPVLLRLFKHVSLNQFKCVY